MAQEKVLIVEDDGIVAAYLEETLIDLGYVVLEPVATGDGAVDRVKTQRPDLVFMDINLAGPMDGVTATERIHSFSDVPVVYLTSYSEESLLEKAKVTRPYGYLVKPVSPQELAATIETALYRHALDEKLRESENRLKLALASSHMGIWEWNAVTDKVFWSPECREIFGTTDFGGPFESFTSLVHPDDLPRVTAVFERVSMEHPLFEADFRTIRPDGEVRWLNGSGQGYFDGTGTLLRMVGTVQDITERKKAEEELRLFKHSIDVHRDGAYWINTDNEFIYVNEAACKALGYERAELIGKPISTVSSTVTDELMKTIWEGLRRGDSFLGEAFHRRKDGSEFPAEIVTTYVHVGDKEYACGFARDISEKKRLEEQLRQAQKMEAVGALAGGIAHDFNNILTVIMGLGNFLQMGIDEDDNRRACVDQIVASSEKAADLVQSLLAFSRKKRITPEPRHVNEVVTNAATLLTRLLPEDISLSMDLTNEDASSLLDVSLMGQVLMNLATNARDAMPQGGSLLIATEPSEMDEAFEKAHGFGRVGKYAKLSVSDTGMGMDAATIERIFEPFFTTKGVGKGTGLGLSSAYGIVKQHDGYITVKSAPGRGTTIDVYLPLLDPSHRQETPVASEVRRGTETILVAEDDRDVRSMLTRVLESHGYETIEAVDGNDAIRVHRQHKHVDLIILDVVMPGKNGKETLDEITLANPRAKAIFVSGYTGDLVIDKGVQRESVDFLQKPISVNALLAKVREVLDR